MDKIRILGILEHGLQLVMVVKTCINLAQHHHHPIDHTHLSQSALDRAEEGIIVQSRGDIVNVVHCELEFLDLLKTIHHLYSLAELRVKVVLDTLSASILWTNIKINN